MRLDILIVADIDAIIPGYAAARETPLSLTWDLTKYGALSHPTANTTGTRHAHAANTPPDPVANNPELRATRY
jgi:hypothetical protein